MKKIAFCFLIYDTIHHEELWNLFFKNIDHCCYSIYIHYKHNVPLQYFEAYKLTHCVDTIYADRSIVHAQNILLENALRDEDNQHFIFLSQSCIPLKHFNYIYRHLDHTVSYFNQSPDSYRFPRCDSLLQYMDKEVIKKASQWCILNRKHSEIVLRNTVYLHWYCDVYAPDEIYYLTTLYFHKLQHELYTVLDVAIGGTTFVNWEGMDYLYPSQRGLKTYSSVSAEELSYLCHSTSLFGRKFVSECADSLADKKYRDFISS
jgi:hypothetical protein